MTTSDIDRSARFTHSESIAVDATPQQVWDVVTDIARTGGPALLPAGAGPSCVRRCRRGHRPPGGGVPAARSA